MGLFSKPKRRQSRAQRVAKLQRRLAKKEKEAKLRKMEEDLKKKLRGY